eukprot:6487596-Amphidinium_carterae.1
MEAAYSAGCPRPRPSRVFEADLISGNPVSSHAMFQLPPAATLVSMDLRNCPSRAPKSAC